MKTNLKITLIMVFSMFISGFSQNYVPEKIAGPVSPEVFIGELKEIPDLINPEFPEAKLEIQQTFGAIAQSIIDGDIDKLISFHAYSPKFTEFKNGEPRNGSEANEAHERNIFGSVTEVVKFDAKDLKIAVYGHVANLTFHSDFQLKFGEDLVLVNDQITLLFVETNDGWKMVHEHHSPLNK